MNREKVIGDLGRIEEKLAPYLDDFARWDSLRKTVRSWPKTDGVAPEVTCAYSGDGYIATLGAAQNERKIKSMRAIFKKVGVTRFLKACSMTLKSLTELVGEASVGDYVVEERTGSRSLTVAKANAAK